jgi:hypothetical protein
LLIDDLQTEAWTRLCIVRDHAPKGLGGRRVWTVNSTARGGGVAEMQRTLLPYWRGSGIDARWLVVQASPAFFKLTKRIHNMLHGSDGDRRLGLRHMRPRRSERARVAARDRPPLAQESAHGAGDGRRDPASERAGAPARHAASCRERHQGGTAGVGRVEARAPPLRRCKAGKRSAPGL